MKTFILATLLLATPAVASEQCAPAASARDAIAKAHGKWVELDILQRAFLVGVYVMNPNTPPGKPYGDRVALASVPGDKGGVVFFIDGDNACNAMPVPDIIIEMLGHVNEITHEGDGL